MDAIAISRPVRLEFALRPEAPDARGETAAEAIRAHLGLQVEAVRTRDLFTIDAELDAEALERVRRELTDPVIQVSAEGRLDLDDPPGWEWMIVIGFRPGVTDNVGRTVGAVLADLLGRPLRADEAVYTARAYLLRGGGLSRNHVESIAEGLLANTLIETIEIIDRREAENGSPAATVPRAGGEVETRVEHIGLEGADERLARISAERILSLSLAEMRAIREHFQSIASDPGRIAEGLDANPTDVELETLAQTWSEHCKHKIFAARIDYTDAEGNRRVIDSLFNTYIKAATERVGERIDWLVSVFDDNAGVVSFNDRLDLVYKVETHNSPSALEPYGGAMTGIVGCNRDPLGTGLGAELLINVWGYCFASPFIGPDDLPKGAMHPRRLRDGVHKGVIDGGNQSGIPYGVGWEFFDPRYMAKPMVYCGTVGLLPKRLSDGRRPGERQLARPGDRVVMVGGRIGKDGIHGATFSSEELHEASPVQAVQIGDPITQKKMSDFLIEARDRGLFRALTDNGAGGLSSSVGEMARGPGGAEVDLSRAPLKYAGLQPWEIWLSEAQERMTLAVPPEQLDELSALAARREVELSDLGEFNASGSLHLRYGDLTVGRLQMRFLHEGCPRMELEAEWTPPAFPEPRWPDPADMADLLRRLLQRPNIACREHKCRQYDHEVKGRTVVKPLIGKRRDVPSDATVFLAEYDGREGIVLAHGFNAHYSDLDTHAMAASVVDEAVRRIIAVGGRLDWISGLDNFCWPDPVQSETTPDGRAKLAQLVRACQGLHDTCVAYGVPLISGKDSMKNDSTRGGRKISIPPSLLFSAMGRIDDIGGAVTADAKASGDRVYVLGLTRAELGGSEIAHLLSDEQGLTDESRTVGGRPPRVDAEAALDLYRAVEAATGEGLVRSLHTPTLGGLAAGLAMVAFGGEMGLEVALGGVPADGELTDLELLFSESNSRFIATVAPERAEAFERRLTGLPCAEVGIATDASRLRVVGQGGGEVIDADLAELKRAWKSTFAGL